MKPHNRLKTIFSCAMLLALTACASIPADFEQVPSHTWQHPEQTQLGTFFDEFAPTDRSLSGVRLISNPKEAFRARFGFAALAEKSLDLQYYLWKDDLTGQLLVFRALQAADRSRPRSKNATKRTTRTSSAQSTSTSAGCSTKKRTTSTPS